MKIFEKNYRISASVIVIGLLLLLTILSLVVYFKAGDSYQKWGSILGSLAAGLIVAIIQLIIAWQDYKHNEKLKELKLIEIMYNRASRDKYANFIKTCNRELDVMGVTAVRFFTDFADTSDGAPENAKVLLRALERGVHVRILLPTKDYLPDEKKADFNKVKEKCCNLENRNNLEIKYFNHTATHSIFRVDDTCIIGPVFPELESRNTPAMHLMKSSPMAVRYMDYFESEWNVAKKLD